MEPTVIGSLSSSLCTTSIIVRNSSLNHTVIILKLHKEICHNEMLLMVDEQQRFLIVNQLPQPLYLPTYFHNTYVGVSAKVTPPLAMGICICTYKNKQSCKIN